MFLLLLSLVVIILVILIVVSYNKLSKERLKVSQAKSTIDVYLTQRFELIPNLVECVKNYKNYEKEIFSKLIQEREKYFRTKELKIGEKLNNEFSQIVTRVEDYPEIKANEQFLELQKNLARLENELQAARRIYNEEVTQYNILLASFPMNVIANMFNFKEEKLFQIEK